MEKGNLAEFNGKADAKSFAEAYRQLESSVPTFDRAIKIYDELIARVDKQPTLPVFHKAVGKLLQESPQFERVAARRGARYSDIGDKPGRDQKPAPGKFSDLSSIMKAQREDLVALRKLTVDTVEAFKGVLPLTEKGEFVRVMLSGRSPFSERYEELVDARSTFTHFYTRGCMVSIQAVMQTYPAGLEFLKGGGAKPK